MRFVKHCVLALLLSCAAPAIAQTANLSFVSEPGDYVGAGQTLSFDEGLSSYGSTDGRIVSVSVNTPEHWFTLNLAAPEGQALAPGAYENAARYPFQESTQPGLDFYGDGRGCNTVEGRFQVEEIRISSFGYVERLKANWELHCQGAEPGLFGSVDITNPPPPPGLEISLKLNTQGLVNSNTGKATVGGTLTCNKPASVNVYGTLTQRTSRVTIAQGDTSAVYACDQTPTAFTATISPANGLPFVNGFAQFDGVATGYDPTYPGVVVTARDSVVTQLKPEKKPKK